MKIIRYNRDDIASLERAPKDYSFSMRKVFVSAFRVRIRRTPSF